MTKILDLDSLFANENCKNYLFWEIGTFLIECIFTCFTIVICIRALTGMRQMTQLKGRRFLHFTQVLFYLSCIIATILYINNHFIYCFTDNYSSVSDITWIIA
eukprot:838725_1